MSSVFRLTGADFTGRGLPNIFPFVAKADLEYAFDFRNRSTRLSDLTGKHIITPKRVEPVAGILNVTDPTVVTTAADGLGINVEMGYLQLNLPLASIPVNGSKQFTIMVVGGWSGIAVPPAKLNANAGTVILFDYGSHITDNGFAIESTGTSTSTAVNVRIESGSSGMIAPTTPVTKKNVTFLTFDGTNWRFICKTQGLTYSGTNTSLGITGNPITINPGNYSNGMVSLGGQVHQTTTIFGATPTLYQHGMWNRVLTDAEIESQYQQTKLNFAAVGV